MECVSSKLKQKKVLNPNQGMVFKFSKEISSFSVKLVEERIAKIPFDDIIRTELKSQILKQKIKKALIQKKYK